MSSQDTISSFGIKKSKDADDFQTTSEAKITPFTIAGYPLLYDKFPPGFLFGCGTSAVQVEGGTDAETTGKGPSVWDALCRYNPGAIDDDTDCSVTCNSYERFEDDVKLLKDINANAYRFSLSWSRILPNGDSSCINKKGIDYYNSLIDALLLQNIQPIVTLWHFDFPGKLGLNWKDEEEIMTHFVNYAEVCFSEFGDRVKYWVTINEPRGHQVAAYDLGLMPPHLNEPEISYQLIYTMIKTHALIYQAYKEKYKEIQKGKIGISLECWGFVPADSNCKDDIDAVKVAYEFQIGCCAHPLFYGEFPPSMRQRVDRRSIASGRQKSRLPEIDKEWSQIIKGSTDFVGLNHYTCEVVTRDKAKLPDGVTPIHFSTSTSLSFPSDEEAIHYYSQKWPGSAAWWLKVTPEESMRSCLNFIKESYGNPEVIVLENGFPTEPMTALIEDTVRADYHTAYLNEVLKGIKLDGCNVTGYIAWCLLDGWELTSGNTVTFGLHHVDYSDPKRKRMQKLSAKTLGKIYRDKAFDK